MLAASMTATLCVARRITRPPVVATILLRPHLWALYEKNRACPAFFITAGRDTRGRCADYPAPRRRPDSSARRVRDTAGPRPHGPRPRARSPGRCTRRPTADRAPSRGENPPPRRPIARGRRAPARG